MTSPLLETVFAAITAAMSAKADMLERGVRSGDYDCPHCGGVFRARLMGKRDHIWARCDGCGAGFIE